MTLCPPLTCLRRSLRVGVLALAGAMTSLPVRALDIGLGDAAGYSGFFFEDVRNLEKAEGPLALGGDLHLASADIGSKVSGGGAPSLVVRGSIHRFLSGFLWWGTIKSFGLFKGVKGSEVGASLDLRRSDDLPVDFELERANLEMLSEQLSELPATGKVTQFLGVTTFTGTKKPLEVFHLTESQVDGLQAVLVSNILSDAHVVINVSADAYRKVSFSMPSSAFMNRHRRVLFNFPDAETVRFNLVTVWGSVLAPRACICVSFGRIEGNVVARQWDSAMTIGFAPFIPHN